MILGVSKKQMKGGEFMQLEIIVEGAQAADAIEMGCCGFDVSFRRPYVADEE